jgi:hypothetical protein
MEPLVMPRAESGMTQITLPAVNRDALMRLKLNVAGQIGHDFAMGALIPVLVEIGIRHESELIALAREQLA